MCSSMHTHTHTHTHTNTHTLQFLAGFMPEGMPPDAVKVIAPIMEKVSITHEHAYGCLID